jgi:hypothetical protein
VGWGEAAHNAIFRAGREASKSIRFRMGSGGSKDSSSGSGGGSYKDSKAATDNRANQLNPNNPAYGKSRGQG